MQLSTKSRYALRILLALAGKKEENTSVKGRDIALAEEITEAYLEQIMITLKAIGMVGTVRGCNGGYFLKRDPADITLLEIIEAFEGQLTFVRCLNNKEICSRSNICSSINTWRRLSETVRATITATTLASIIEENRQLNDAF